MQARDRLGPGFQIALTEEGVKVPPRLIGRWAFEYPASIPQRVGVQNINRKYKHVKQDGDRQNVQREEVLGGHPGLAVKEHDSQYQGEHPLWEGLGPRQLVQRVQVILETTVQAGGDLEASGDEEPADAADAADEDVAGDEADHEAKLESAHQVEDHAGDHGAHGVRDNSRRDHGVRVLLAHRVCDFLRHVVEERHHFYLSEEATCVSWYQDCLARSDLTSSDPTAPLKILPDEKVN